MSLGKCHLKYPQSVFPWHCGWRQPKQTQFFMHVDARHVTLPPALGISHVQQPLKDLPSGYVKITIENGH